MDIDRLPNAYLIGAAKGGTSFVYECLKSHPQVYEGPVKEPHFFSNDLIFKQGVDYYLDTFFPGGSNFRVRCDATPHYLYYEKAARRMARILPPTHRRFIVLLRNPVDRAYSLYWNMVHEGHERLTFEQAIAVEAERIETGEDTIYGRIRYQYVDSGLYAKQLRAYLRYFDRRNFLFIFYDDLLRDPVTALKTIFRFVDVEEEFRIDTALRANQASTPRLRSLQTWLRRPSAVRRCLGRALPMRAKHHLASLLIRLNRKNFVYPPMDPATRNQLCLRFHTDLLDLETITGRKLESWLGSKCHT